MTFVAGTVLTAAALNSELAAKYDSAPAINAQTGTTYTFVLADATAGKTVTASNASASTYTVPPQSSVAFSAGALLRVTNLGAGVVTFAGGAGVTVTNTAGTLAQYQKATLVRTGSDAWTVIPFGGGAGMSLVNKTDFTAAASVSINNVFTTAAANYLMVVDLVVNTGTTAVQMRLRASGADSSAASYRYGGGGGNGSATSTFYGGDLLTLFALTGNATAGSPAAFALTVIKPQVADKTRVTGTALWRSTAVVDIGGAFGGSFDATTQFDGFTLIASANTMTGTVRTYSLLGT